MTSRRKFFQYAQTGSAQQRPQQAALSPSGQPGSSARPGPGPRGSSFQPAPGGGIITPHPAPGVNIQPPGPGGVGTGGPANPMIRMLYPEMLSEQGEIVNSPHCYLPNTDPNAIPTVDRGRPLDSFDKAVRLGFQPQPRSLGFATRGDAAMGDTIFRRVQLFAQLAPVGGNIQETTFHTAIGLATHRSSDNRPRNWHVSVFGIGTQLSAGVPRGPLAESQIVQNGGFWPNVGSVAGVLSAGSSLAPYVPQITTFKARAMIHDESGQRFFDFDVIGTRSFDVAAYAVTIFILLPDNGFELSQLNPNAPASDGTPLVFSGILQDAMVGARIVGSSFEPLERRIQQTQSISLAGAVAAARMPIPPGARTVQLYSQGRTAADLAYAIDFEAVSPTDTDPSAALPLLGPIVIDPVTFRSDVIEIPNAATIAFRGTIAPSPNAFTAIFTVDP